MVIGDNLTVVGDSYGGVHSIPREKFNFFTLTAFFIFQSSMAVSRHESMCFYYFYFASSVGDEFATQFLEDLLLVLVRSYLPRGPEARGEDTIVILSEAGKKS